MDDLRPNRCYTPHQLRWGSASVGQTASWDPFPSWSGGQKTVPKRGGWWRICWRSQETPNVRGGEHVHNASCLRVWGWMSGVNVTYVTWCNDVRRKFAQCLSPSSNLSPTSYLYHLFLIVYDMFIICSHLLLSLSSLRGQYGTGHYRGWWGLWAYSVELHHFQQVVLLQVHSRGLGSSHSDHIQMGLGTAVHQVVHSDVAICRTQHGALVGKDPGTHQQ